VDEHIDADRDQMMNYLCKQTSQIIGHGLDSADYKKIHARHFASEENHACKTHFLN